jgi:hypothetical protein
MVFLRPQEVCTRIPDVCSVGFDIGIGVDEKLERLNHARTFKSIVAGNTLAVWASERLKICDLFIKIMTKIAKIIISIMERDQIRGYLNCQ